MHSLNDVIFKLFPVHKTLSIQPEGFLLSDVAQSGVTPDKKTSQTETESKSLCGISHIIVLYYGLFATTKLSVPCDALNTILENIVLSRPIKQAQLPNVIDVLNEP